MLLCAPQQHPIATVPLCQHAAASAAVVAFSTTTTTDAADAAAASTHHHFTEFEQAEQREAWKAIRTACEGC